MNNGLLNVDVRCAESPVIYIDDKPQSVCWLRVAVLPSELDAFRTIIRRSGGKRIRIDGVEEDT